MKKLISLVLAVVMICGVAAVAHPFTDVKGHWAEGQLDIAYKNGMINGDPDGRFRPDENISRAEFMKMMTAATAAWCEIPQSEIDKFTDKTHWAGKYYQFALYQGWIINYDYGSEPEFKEFADSVRVGELLPGNMDKSNFDIPIERWEMAYMASRYAHSLCGVAMSKKNNTGFADYQQAKELYPATVLNHIACSYGAGIMTGDTDGKLNPMNNGTRAEAAVIVNRYLGVIDKEYKTIPDTVEKYTDIPSGHPVAVVTFSDERSIEIELYPEYAPQTVAHFVAMVKDGVYNEEFSVEGVNKDRFPSIGSLCAVSTYKDVEKTVYGEFAKNGYNKNTLPFEKGACVMDYMWNYNDGSVNFKILAEDMTENNGKAAAFGKVVKGMDIIETLSDESGFAIITNVEIK